MSRWTPDLDSNILIIGKKCSGKTTLLNDLMQQAKGFHTVFILSPHKNNEENFRKKNSWNFWTVSSEEDALRRIETILDIQRGLNDASAPESLARCLICCDDLSDLPFDSPVMQHLMSDGDYFGTTFWATFQQMPSGVYKNFATILTLGHSDEKYNAIVNSDVNLYYSAKVDTTSFFFPDLVFKYSDEMEFNLKTWFNSYFTYFNPAIFDFDPELPEHHLHWRPTYYMSWTYRDEFTQLHIYKQLGDSSYFVIRTNNHNYVKNTYDTLCSLVKGEYWSKGEARNQIALLIDDFASEVTWRNEQPQVTLSYAMDSQFFPSHLHISTHDNCECNDPSQRDPWTSDDDDDDVISVSYRESKNLKVWNYIDCPNGWSLDEENIGEPRRIVYFYGEGPMARKNKKAMHDYLVDKFKKLEEENAVTDVYVSSVH